MTRSTAALLAPMLAGCSLLYNPNNLPAPAIDAAGPADVFQPVDANDSLLVITDVAPRVINEGQGEGGSLPALVVIHGQNLVNSNLKVELIPPDGVTVKLSPITDAQASHDAGYVAFTVTAHVDDALEADVPLQLRVTQDVSPQYGGGTVTRPGPMDPPVTVTLHGLPELTSAKLVSGKLATTLPATVYSMVDLSDVPTLGFTGTDRAEISAVSSISLRAVAADADNTTPGPGGLGGSTGPGTGCGAGGIGGNVTGLGLLGSGGGGGGAGYGGDGDAGSAGTGLGAGAAGGRGLQCGDGQLVSFVTDRASSGGGGGTGNLSGIGLGGEGGAGGGTLVLDAGGNITATNVSAHGGAGANRNNGGGGGGGGAGGTLLFSSLNGTVAIASVDVAGGVPGMPNGGAGAVGRLRWDSPMGAAPVTSNAATQRGPAFTVAEHVFTTASPQLTLNGTANSVFDVRVIDHDNESHDGEHNGFNSVGFAAISPTLLPGHNRVCVMLAGGERGSLAERCVDVAFLP